MQDCFLTAWTIAADGGYVAWCANVKVVDKDVTFFLERADVGHLLPFNLAVPSGEMFENEDEVGVQIGFRAAKDCSSKGIEVLRRILFFFCFFPPFWGAQLAT